MTTLQIPSRWLQGYMATGRTLEEAGAWWQEQDVLQGDREPDPFEGLTLREFSMCGPCIPLGTVISHTSKTVTFLSDPNGPDYPGRVLRRGGHAWTHGLGTGTLHVQPCPSCRDHEHTQYPNGYMD